MYANDIYRYQDYEHSQFGSLRVINEDRVQPRTGFGTHSHREFEIFSYVVSGELEQYAITFPLHILLYTYTIHYKTAKTLWATPRSSREAICS